MKLSLSLVAATIAVVPLAWSFAPAQAAPIAPSPVAQTDGAILQVQNWETFHGDRHNAFRDDGWDDGWRPRHRRHHRHHGYYPQAFYFGFPFAFAPPYYPYNRHRDCFRTWDGQLVCR